ncbi:MAG: hypothetical protein H0T51_01150 [Pirellulales bacterium]|nr:hypothetical protein [Pirellulales bacterium]
MLLAMSYINRDLTFEIRDYRFGFVDLTFGGHPAIPSHGISSSPEYPYTVAHLGPLGSLRVPVSAAVAWWLVAFTLIAAVGLSAVYASRRRTAHTA